MEKEEEEEDRKREAAISSSPCLQPNFNPKAVTQDQLSKFRLIFVLKSKSKFKTKPKDESKKKKAQGNDVYSKNGGAQGLKNDNKEQSLYSKNEESRGGVSASKKPKLHWGLDTKERWERKSNV
ncbi:hypothetical protein P8452_54909 [Trifolium repens]|nr:hypothetical protein P8452_54909 [Trifolium repens]